jgi:hypothetical protein
MFRFEGRIVLQFYHEAKMLYRKAVSPITIMFIPHDDTRRTINLNIPVAILALLTFFSFAGATYLCSLIPDVIRYRAMEQQFHDYSQKVSDLNTTLLSLKKTEKELHAQMSLGSKEKISEREDSSKVISLNIANVHQQIESSIQTIDAIKDYIRKQKDLYLATSRGLPTKHMEGKSNQEKRILFHIKAVDMNKYDRIISRASAKYNVDTALIKAIIKTESNFDQRAVSPNGAQGLMQLMPETAYALQVEDAFHPENNIEAGTRYLRYLLNLFEDNLPVALAAYNAGENAVIKHNNNIPPYKETEAYVQRVLDHLNSYRQIGQSIKQGKVICNRDSKRYHLPGMKYYHLVETHRRVEFSSEDEAIKAGYHKAPR